MSNFSFEKLFDLEKEEEEKNSLIVDLEEEKFSIVDSEKN